MTDSRLEQDIGYRFRDRVLLQTALTHRSYCSPHNERLEFLGDAVLNAVIARSLFERFPMLAEGELSRLRAHLVRERGACTSSPWRSAWAISSGLARGS